jgi:hypothetical protein
MRLTSVPRPFTNFGFDPVPGDSSRLVQTMSNIEAALGS